MRKIVKKGDVVEVDSSEIEYYDMMALPKYITEKETTVEAEITDILVGKYQYEVFGEHHKVGAFCGKVKSSSVVSYITTDCQHRTRPVWHDVKEKWICPFCINE